MKRHFALAALGLVVNTGGCAWVRPYEPKAINCYLAERADLANVRRIMVLPFTQEDGVQADTQMVRDAFVGELQKLRRFEVVPLPPNAQEDDLLNASIHRGRLSTEAMVRLCNRYALDGVFVGTVTKWRAYQPPHLGMRTQLVSVHSGATVWAVDAIYDTTDQTTIADLRHYVERVQHDDGALHGWEMTMLAPNRFTNYVAYRFTTTWVES
ncbi:MAG: hypothetical protein JNK49_19190 [Planctomycetes bacterium]|nr:hypothetical protein [Planctomycetota bacterium]